MNQRLYDLGRSHAPGLLDVTIGNNTETFRDASNTLVTVPGFNAAPGYDLASGWGTLDANVFCRQLAN